jgi:hypothetical protein
MSPPPWCSPRRVRSGGARRPVRPGLIWSLVVLRTGLVRAPRDGGTVHWRERAPGADLPDRPPEDQRQECEDCARCQAFNMRRSREGFGAGRRIGHSGSRNSWSDGQDIRVRVSESSQMPPASRTATMRGSAQSSRPGRSTRDRGDLETAPRHSGELVHEKGRDRALFMERPDDSRRGGRH